MNGVVMVTSLRSGMTALGLARCILMLSLVLASSKARADNLQAEDVVPATTVETGRVVPELVEDFLHLEGGGQGLNENSTPDLAVREAELRSGGAEDIVPEASLKVVLHLGKVEVRSQAALDELGSVVEEVETKVE